MDPMTLLLTVGGMLTLTLLGFAYILAPSPDKVLAKRLDKMRDRLSTSHSAIAKAQMRKLMNQQDSKLDTVFGAFIPRPAKMRERLARTGKGWTLGRYAMICGTVALLIAGAAIVAGGLPVIIALFLGIIGGLGLPHMYVNRLINKRLDKFIGIFPDAIDLLVRSLRSGLPVTEAIGVVGKEMSEPVGVEFANVSDKIRIGKTLDQALQDSSARVATPEFQFFVIALAIQRETGGNLAETLGNLGEVLRKRHQMKLKIRAMSSESKASAYIVGALPFLVFGIISFVNPGYIAPFFSDPRLMIAGIGGLCWMSMGVFIMMKMVSFEI